MDEYSDVASAEGFGNGIHNVDQLGHHTTWIPVSCENGDPVQNHAHEQNRDIRVDEPCKNAADQREH